MKRLFDEIGQPASDGFYRWVMETGSQGVWVIDAEGLTTFVNARLAQMMRVTREEMLGRSIFDFSDPAHESRSRLRFAELRSGSGSAVAPADDEPLFFL